MKRSLFADDFLNDSSSSESEEDDSHELLPQAKLPTSGSGNSHTSAFSKISSILEKHGSASNFVPPSSQSKSAIEPTNPSEFTFHEKRTEELGSENKDSRKEEDEEEEEKKP